MGHYPIIFILLLGKLQISNSKYISLESHIFVSGNRLMVSIFDVKGT